MSYSKVPKRKLQQIPRAKEYAKKLLAFFGPKGDNWTTGELRAKTNFLGEQPKNEKMAYCLLGATLHLKIPEFWLQQAIRKQTPHSNFGHGLSVGAFNDRAKSFEPIKKLLTKIAKNGVTIPIACLLFAIALPLAKADVGQHRVTLSWTASPTQGVTYNIYKSSSAGVCTGNPLPYATGIVTTTYTDTLGLSDGQIVFYNVAAVKNGGVSTCDGEVQVQIPVSPAPPSGLNASPQ